MNAPVPLRPLQCAGCGAALPLGQEPTARCPFCNTRTPVPEAHLALQRSAKSFAADRRLAEQLYGEIGKPPGWFLRTWGLGAEGATGVGVVVARLLGGLAMKQPHIAFGLVLVLAYAIGYPVAGVYRALCWLAGQPVLSGVAATPVLLVAALLIVLLVGIPTVLFGRERALADIRKDIHASLAAALPERPGGPSRCRTCGAALDVPPGALGVPCAYCGADNLVALPPAWVTRVQSSEFHHFLRIDAALEAYRAAGRKATEGLWQLFVGIVLTLPVVWLTGYILDSAGFGF